MKFHPQIDDNLKLETDDGLIIRVVESRSHSKASEKYLDIEVRFPSGEEFSWSIPTEYRRTGVDLNESTANELKDYIVSYVQSCDPANWAKWREEQEAFWATRGGAVVTKPFFDALASDFKWKSGESDLPVNPNSQRRIQDLKEMGYTLATHTSMTDQATGKKCTHHILMPVPRGGLTGYETISASLKKRIIGLLGSYDAFEGKVVNKDSLLPDHKFPEIRWDDQTRRESLDDLSDDHLGNDFQLLNNQRNQQKRESCRKCFQTGKRPFPYGLPFYYEGGEDWPADVPTRGKDAEYGCVGCGWYDLEQWRRAAKKRLE